MARANIYLSPELHKAVKAAGIPISEICQRALWAEVQRLEVEATARRSMLWDHNQPGGSNVK